MNGKGAGILAVVILIFEFCVISSEAKASCAIAGNDSLRAGKDYSFHSHAEIIAMYTDLCDRHPTVTRYESIGKTYLGNSIWAFKIGNPKGTRIIMDGCIHGWEDLGSEAGFLWATWLLETENPTAKKILNEICWMIVPVINYDSYLRGNANKMLCEGGVDLNRNFTQGWTYVEGCTGSFNTSHGIGPASEKETQVMHAFLKKNKPEKKAKAIYINTHFGGGPWIWYSGSNQQTFYLPIRNKIIQGWSLNQVALNHITLNQFLPPTTKQLPAPAGITGDATDLGYEPFTIEICNQNCRNGYRFVPANISCTDDPGESNKPSWEVFENELYPIFDQVFLAISEYLLEQK